eukprot:14664214-Heterocapsa_arctica.AAC.1
MRHRSSPRRRTSASRRSHRLPAAVGRRRPCRLSRSRLSAGHSLPIIRAKGRKPRMLRRWSGALIWCRPLFPDGSLIRAK